MVMKCKITDSGITVTKFLKSKHIKYEDIQSIIEDDGLNYINTKDGESTKVDLFYASITIKYPALLQYIEKYNIDFRVLDDLKDESLVCFYEEAFKIAHDTEEKIRRFANEAIAETLGAGYSIETRFYDDKKKNSGVYLVLLKDGNVVNPPKDNNILLPEMDPDAFDLIELIYGPIQWDTVNRCAKYGVTIECRDEDACRKAVYECVKDLGEHYSS